MSVESRLQEAIKQVGIVIEDEDDSDIIRELEAGKESLEEAQKLFDA